MALLLRINKAAPLTNAEVDDNFLYLDGRITSVENAKLTTTDLLTKMLLVDGAGSLLDADKLHAMIPYDQNVFNSIVSRDVSGNFSATTITANLIGNATTATNALGFSGIIPIINGGSGVSALPTGYVKSDGSILSTSTTVSAADVAGDIPGLASNVSGIVTLAHGGTGGNTAAAARTALELIPGQTIQGYSNNLQGLSNLATNGLVTRVNGSIYSRTIEYGNGLNVSNADGISGNPRIELTVVPVTSGGTGGNTPGSARAGIGAAAADGATLTGIPTAPTAPVGTKSTQIATTEFVINTIIQPGCIIYSATQTPPYGYILADGLAHNNTDYPALYAAIGVRFGTNGAGTFKVPLLQAQSGLISIIKT